MNILIIIMAIFLLQQGVVYAQNPYIREGSIGKQNAQVDLPSNNSNDSLSFRPIEKWVGEKFIFLPKSKSLQKFGYLLFKGGTGGLGRPTYEECVGRIGTIIDVTKDLNKITIQIKMNDNNQIYIAEGFYDCVDGIAPVADIDFARNKWIGKTLWYSEKEISTYNDNTENFGSIICKKYSPVKVINIVAGWYSSNPVRFIIQLPSGEEGFEDINLSGTNTSSILRDINRFEDSFNTKDPRKIYKWSPKVWSAIEKGKVFIGMNAQQARMSWGNPDSINNTIINNRKHEQWVYGTGNYLYFDNGNLTSIQN